MNVVSINYQFSAGKLLVSQFAASVFSNIIIIILIKRINKDLPIYRSLHRIITPLTISELLKNSLESLTMNSLRY